MYVNKRREDMKDYMAENIGEDDEEDIRPMYWCHWCLIYAVLPLRCLTMQRCSYFMLYSCRIAAQLPSSCRALYHWPDNDDDDGLTIDIWMIRSHGLICSSADLMFNDGKLVREMRHIARAHYDHHLGITGIIWARSGHYWTMLDDEMTMAGWAVMTMFMVLIAGIIGIIYYM